MKIEAKNFIAHYRIEDNTVQTVEEHLQGVMDLCERYTHALSFSNTGKMLGLLHDMGKFSNEFYEYITEAIAEEKANEKDDKQGSSVDHGKYGAMLMLERYHNGDVIRRTMAEIVAMIICYHHGGLEDYITDDLEIRMFTRCGLADKNVSTGNKSSVENKANPSNKGNTDGSYIQVKERFFNRMIMPEQLDIMFDAAVNEFRDYINKGRNSGTISSFNIHLLIKFLYSCLIDADRYDTYLFMNKKVEEEAIDINQLWKRFDKSLSVKEEAFRNKITNSAMEEAIKQLRHDIWKQCRDFSKQPTGIYTLTVPTGGGKTLSSLRYALDHAMISGKRRILYILPFTAIIEQNAEVVRNTLDADEYILEFHSNVVTDDGSEGKGDNYAYRQLLTEQWTSPIILTTMVQFLNTFFASGTKDIRRLHNLTDTIIIFDEIQALPVKCISLFNETVNFLSSQCRDTIILCSATQPNLDRVKHKINIRKEMITDIKDKFEQFKRMQIIDARYRRKMSIPEVGDFIYDLKKDNETILMVLNTKKAAEEVYREVKNRLEDNEILFYFLSTNLCPTHRKKVIKEMKEALEQHKHVVCVSTQLIEAGVDISFTCVVRHVAGLDSIAQASGRGNRNGESGIKNTYIIQLEDERLGSLKELEVGEKCTTFVLNDYALDHARFDHDLLSPRSIKQYYDYFFQDPDIDRKMDYPIYEKDDTIFNKLSSTNKRNAYKKTYNCECPLTLEYQFKSAARSFEVIDEAAKSILVPYGDGATIISSLLSHGGPLLDMGLIRKAQPFMVNVPLNTYEKLKSNHAILMDEKSGVLLLADGFYDDELGIVAEGGRMKTLMIGL